MPGAPDPTLGLRLTPLDGWVVRMWALCLWLDEEWMEMPAAVETG